MADPVLTIAKSEPLPALTIAKSEPASVTSQPLVTQMGERPEGGYTFSDSDSGNHPVMDMLSSAAHPQELKDFLSLLLPSEVGAGLPGNLKDMAKSWISAGQKAYAATPSVKALPATMLRELYYNAFGKTPPVGARLITNPSSPLADILNELRATDTANMPAEAIGGTAKAVLPRSVNVVPSDAIPGMQATLPDKWGMTAIQSPELARLAPNSAWTGQQAGPLSGLIRPGEVISPEKAQGIELGKLLQKLASGRGGQ